MLTQFRPILCVGFGSHDKPNPHPKPSPNPNPNPKPHQSRVEKIKLNDRFVSAAANGEYRVQLPALQSAQPVPLLKYITSP